MIEITPLLFVDHKSGSWRLHVKAEVDSKRGKIFNCSSFENLCKTVLEKHAGDCSSLEDVLKLYQEAIDRIDALTGTEDKSQQLRLIGMARAEKNANKKIPGWSEQAYSYLERYPAKEFMAEDLRSWAHSLGLALPPSARAWGGVMAKAARNGLIIRNGFRATKNKNAHKTPATVWLNARFLTKEEAA